MTRRPNSENNNLNKSNNKDFKKTESLVLCSSRENTSYIYNVANCSQSTTSLSSQSLSSKSRLSGAASS